MTNHPQLRVALDPGVAEVQDQLETVRFWQKDHSGADLCGARFRHADLRNSDFRGAYLRATDFSFADLSGTDLRGTYLLGADLSFANLSRADLRGAYLFKANFEGAILRDASLQGANLISANLSRAMLDGTDVTCSVMANTGLGNLDLSKTKGLEKVWHKGPSTICVNTMHRSRGSIPASFLRGAGILEPGVGDLVISAQHHAIPFCLLSYSAENRHIAEQIYESLQIQNIRCWQDCHTSLEGKLDEPAKELLRFHDCLIVLLSRESLSSEWLASLRDESEQGKRFLLPLPLISRKELSHWKHWDELSNANAELAGQEIPDFSEWQDASLYHKALSRTVHILKQVRAA